MDTPSDNQKWPLLLGTSIVAWVALVALGWFALASYAHRPTSSGDSRSEWPAECPFDYATDRPTIVLVVHPRCPCTLATVKELVRIVREVPRPLRIELVSYRPADEQWPQTELETTVAALPDTTVRPDTEGAIAAAFGVTVSGHLLAFDPDGTLRQSGGLTASRGHEGRSAGGRRLVRWLEGASLGDESNFPVYGCEIFEASFDADLESGR